VPLDEIEEPVIAARNEGCSARSLSFS
jgi:hypothetical protein